MPLSRAAVELLAGLPRDDEYIFPGAGKSTVTREAMRLCLRRHGLDCTTHGFRAAFSTWASEQTSFPDVVVELALAHQVGNAVSRAYGRSDLLEQRRALMADWSDFLNSA